MDVVEWVESRLDTGDKTWKSKKYWADDFKSNNKTMAGAIYRKIAEKDAEIHLVADKPVWATKGNIKKLLANGFKDGCVRLWAAIEHDNHRCKKLAYGLGFKKRAHKADCEILCLSKSDFEKRWMR